MMSMQQEKAAKRAKASVDKFPSTPHLANLGTLPIRGDKVFTERERAEFLAHDVLVEEKIDGANLGMYFDDQGAVQLQNRGSYIFSPYHGQWKKIPDWLKHHIDRLFDALGKDYMLFGEWCFARHSIEYSRLPEWFIGFDVYDLMHKRFLASSYRNEVLEQAGIPVIAEVGKGRFSLDDLVWLMNLSAYTESPCEGLYLRLESGRWLENRAKLVRPEFVQAIDSHWSRKTVHPNKVIQTWI